NRSHTCWPGPIVIRKTCRPDSGWRAASGAPDAGPADDSCAAVDPHAVNDATAKAATSTAMLALRLFITSRLGRGVDGFHHLECGELFAEIRGLGVTLNRGDEMR